MRVFVAATLAAALSSTASAQAPVAGRDIVEGGCEGQPVYRGALAVAGAGPVYRMR